MSVNDSGGQQQNSRPVAKSDCTIQQRKELLVIQNGRGGPVKTALAPICCADCASCSSATAAVSACHLIQCARAQYRLIGFIDDVEQQPLDENGAAGTRMEVPHPRITLQNEVSPPCSPQMYSQGRFKISLSKNAPEEGKATPLLQLSSPHTPLCQPKPVRRPIFGNPFAIWRTKFQLEYACAESRFQREVLLISLPHIVVMAVVSAYVVCGAFLFQRLDDDMAQLPFHEVLLFSFTTITTIGYGNIVPRSQMARALCVPFCMLGIPLVFLSLANLGELVAELYWVLVSAVRGDCELAVEDFRRLPLKVVVCLILAHSLLGGLIFHCWLDQMDLLSAIYFSFISITTIGFGDLSPKPQGMCHTLATMAYLVVGIAIMSTLFSALSDHLRRIHYLGRHFEGAQDVCVWFGGTRMSIAELISLVADRFDISPERFRKVLDELDALIHLALMRGERAEGLPNDASPSPAGAPSSSIASLNSEQEQLIQALSTLHRLTVKGQRTFSSPSLNSLSVRSTLPIRDHSRSSPQETGTVRNGRTRTCDT